MQSIHLTETYAYGMKKDPVCEKEEMKFNNIIKQYKMFNFDYITRKYIKRK